MFRLKAPFAPSGDQPRAIEQLLRGRPGISTLLGVTGSGKTFTMANLIAQHNKPALIISPNKTLAAQLYEEFSVFFPDNRVCYFVSYYDYYQPESYLPAQDIYVPKETKINSELERLRIEATASIINRPDTIVIASVSCIYSLGNPQDYRDLTLTITRGQQLSRADFLRQLIFIQYDRNDIDKSPGTFQVYGNTVEIQLPYQREKLRVDFFGNEIDRIEWVTKHDNHVVRDLDDALIFPARHFVTTKEKKDLAIASIERELEAWLPELKNPLYRERLKTRVSHDIELLLERGTCPGIENYSIHFDGRLPGQAPYTLLDFFDDFLLIVDESHIALPQFRGMYAGDRARKQSLIEYGFRLPSAYDNRPLMFHEIEKYFKDVVFVSATPGDYEQTHSTTVAEQIIRPTGLVDPAIELHPRTGQLQHLLQQIKDTSKKGYRTLITVLTKQLAEELAYYLEEQKVKVCYLHHELKTPQRTELIHKLRLGVFECLVGINLLREGLDIPEVALMAIMDADVESFLRDKRSLIQTIGRAARNAQSRVIMYADKITKSMEAAIQETNRRRALQQAYNEEHGITPKTVVREVTKSISPLQEAVAQASASKGKKKTAEKKTTPGAPPAARVQYTTPQERAARRAELEYLMQQAAAQFEFERAIQLREEWLALQDDAS